MIRLCFERPLYPVLIIAPNLYLSHQWAKEWKKWVIGAPVVVVDKKSIDSIYKAEGATIICITTYYYLQRTEVDFEPITSCFYLLQLLQLLLRWLLLFFVVCACVFFCYIFILFDIISCPALGCLC